MLKRLCIRMGMTPDELIMHLEKQISERGLDPLSYEQIDLLGSENPADAPEREAMLEDMRDRVGLDVPDECFSCVDDDERSNGPRRSGGPRGEEIADSAAHDRAAQAVATGTGELSGVHESVLVHAARYEGAGWSQRRRSELVAEFRRRNGL